MVNVPSLKPVRFRAAVVIEDIVFVRTEVNGFKSNTWLYFGLIQKFPVRKEEENITGVYFFAMMQNWYEIHGKCCYIPNKNHVSSCIWMVIPESALCFVCNYKASIKSFISGSHYLFKRNSFSEAIFKAFSTTFKMVFSISGKESWSLGLADSLSKWPVHQFCSVPCCGKELQTENSQIDVWTEESAWKFGENQVNNIS